MKIVRESLPSIFILENVQQAKSILKKQNIPETDPTYQELRQMLEEDNKLGYLGKFTKWIFKEKTPFEEVKELYNLIKTTNVKVPPIDAFKTAEEMYDTIRSKEGDQGIESLIKLIPSNARRVLDTPELRHFIADNLKYSNYIKEFFLTASGGFVNNPNRKPEDFIPSLETIIENAKGGWDLDSVKQKIQKYPDVNIAYQSPEAIAFSIGDYDTAKELCSQSWCIATSRHYFDSYADLFNVQYVIYDFSKKRTDVRSIMGVTVNADGSFREAMFKNNHPWYYPNHPQPTGYSHTKLHDPAINIKTQLKDLGVYSHLTPRDGEQITQEIERRISGMNKELAGKGEGYKIYHIKSGNDIRKVVSGGFGQAQDDIFYNFYLILDDNGEGYKKVLGIKVSPNGDLDVMDAKGHKVDKEYLSRFE
jgi:hypothetical protein